MVSGTFVMDGEGIYMVTKDPITLGSQVFLPKFIFGGTTFPLFWNSVGREISIIFSRGDSMGKLAFTASMRWKTLANFILS